MRPGANESRVDFEDLGRGQLSQRGGKVGDEDLDPAVAEPFRLLEGLEEDGGGAEAAQVLDGLLGGEGGGDEEEGGARDGVGRDEGVGGPPHAAGPGGSPLGQRHVETFEGGGGHRLQAWRLKA